MDNLKYSSNVVIDLGCLCTYVFFLNLSWTMCRNVNALLHVKYEIILFQFIQNVKKN